MKERLRNMAKDLLILENPEMKTLIDEFFDEMSSEVLILHSKEVLDLLKELSENPSMISETDTEPTNVTSTGGHSITEDSKESEDEDISISSAGFI